LFKSDATRYSVEERAVVRHRTGKVDGTCELILWLTTAPADERRCIVTGTIAALEGGSALIKVTPSAPHVAVKSVPAGPVTITARFGYVGPLIIIQSQGCDVSGATTVLETTYSGVATYTEVESGTSAPVTEGVAGLNALVIQFVEFWERPAFSSLAFKVANSDIIK
jgi:hypothetical protein